MKKRNRVLSGILTAAMLATSVWGGYGVTSYAAETDGKNEAGIEASLAEAGNQLLSWTSAPSADGEILEDGLRFEREAVSFQTEEYEVSGISGESGWEQYTNWNNMSQATEDKIVQAFGITDTVTSISLSESSYQWYKETENGRVELSSETDVELYNNYSALASDGTTKFILKITPAMVYVESEDEEGNDTSDEYYFSNLEADVYEYSIEDVFTYQYDGSEEKDPITVYTQDEQRDARANSKQTFEVDAARNNTSLVKKILY